jgi:hypothetical protein
LNQRHEYLDTIFDGCEEENRSVISNEALRHVPGYLDAQQEGSSLNLERDS